MIVGPGGRENLKGKKEEANDGDLGNIYSTYYLQNELENVLTGRCYSTNIEYLPHTKYSADAESKTYENPEAQECDIMKYVM